MTEPLSPERERKIRRHYAVFAPTVPVNMLLAELDRVRDERDEAFRCRDAAQRALYRDDIDTDVHLPDLIGDGLHGLAEWDTEPSDQAPEWLINAIVDLVRPVLAKVTDERDRARRIAVTLEQETARLEDEAAEQRAAQDPTLRCLLVKAAEDRDLYVGWSRNCDAPTGVWSWETALSYGFPRSKVERASLYGTSSHIGDGAWDDDGFVAEQRGWLQRELIGEYAVEYLHGDRETAYAMLQPLNTEAVDR